MASPNVLMKEAQQLQQQGERRKGQQAVDAFEKATARYRAILSSPHPLPAPAHEIQFNLADCLHMAGEALLETAKGANDTATEDRIAQQALRCFEECVSVFGAVVDANSGADEESITAALVNQGNALSSAGALLPPQQGVGVLGRAVEAYRAAVQHTPNDADTLNNLADTMVQTAEATAINGHTSTAQSIYKEAMHTYQQACSCSNAQLGDDLPSLLHNWGLGLLSMAQHLSGEGPGKEGTLDTLELQGVLDEAVTRLKKATSFSRGDPAPYAALGDVFVAQAELAPDAQDQVGLYQTALQEGYAAALRVRGNFAAGLVGTAEVHAELARRHAHANEVARQHWQACTDAYQAALRLPAGELGSFQERCDVRYNYACALALSGRVEEARMEIAALVQCGAVSMEDVHADEDLAGMV